MHRGRRGSRGQTPATILMAIKAVGELLAAEGETVGIVVVGGTAMVLRGVATRLTEDVDVIATAKGAGGGQGAHIERADPLPKSLLRAIARVARDFDLPPDWMNSVVTAQWDLDLPPGFEGRIHWEQHGGLALGVADRVDLVFLKLYAAADSEGPESIHYQDLLALRPSQEELEAAARWSRAQDTSPEFSRVLDEVVGHVSKDH